MARNQVVSAGTKGSGFVFNVGEPIIDRNFFVFIFDAEIFNIKSEVRKSFLVEKEGESSGS